jgi:hypothetical protein
MKHASLRRPLGWGLPAGAIALAFALIGHPAMAAEAKADMLRVEVAEIGSRFRLDEQYVDADGLATRGAAFLAEGYVYPAGTLSCDGFACDGVIYDAAGTPSPEFPDKVMGTWICTGTHLEDAAVATSEPVSFTTQLFDLGERPGEMTLVTTGLEIPTQGMPVQRAITGGTGRYAQASGTQAQTFLGFNNIDLTHEGKTWAGVTLAMELHPR